MCSGEISDRLGWAYADYNIGKENIMSQILKQKYGWIGKKFDFDKFDELKKQWVKKSPHSYHCPIHNTYFDLEGSDEVEGMDAEPCWQCHDSCETTL